MRYVTTAWQGLSEEQKAAKPEAGGLFRIDIDVKGLSEPRSAGWRRSRLKLLHGGLSPFVRKVMIVAHEKGLMDRLKLVPAPVNPLGKIPALTLEDGAVLYGVTVVAEYLDALDGAPRFFPAGAGRWRALRRNATGDGILDAGNLVRIEGLRPEEKQWADWREVQLLKVTNALDAAERETGSLAVETPAIGEVAYVCAFGCTAAGHGRRSRC